MSIQIPPSAEKAFFILLGIAAAVLSQFAIVNDTPAENMLLLAAGTLLGKEFLPGAKKPESKGDDGGA